MIPSRVFPTQMKKCVWLSAQQIWEEPTAEQDAGNYTGVQSVDEQ